METRWTACLLGAAVLTGCGRPNTDTSLTGAARAGDATRVQALLAAGADANQPSGGNGWTPLMHAVHKRRLEAARVLLKGGADPNARGGGGATALIMAAAYGDSKVVGLLLAAGADPYAQTPGGVNALTNASGGGGLFDITDGPPLGQCHPETVKLLLARAPDLPLRAAPLGRVSQWLRHGPGCEETARLMVASSGGR